MMTSYIHGTSDTYNIHKIVKGDDQKSQEEENTNGVLVENLQHHIGIAKNIIVYIVAIALIFHLFINIELYKLTLL